MKLLFHGVGIYPEGKSFGPAQWPHHDLLIVREGEALLRTKKGEIHLQGGDGIWIPPGLRFEGLAKDGRIMMWVLHFRSMELKPRQFTQQRESGFWVFREGTRSDLAEAMIEHLHRIYQGDSCWPAHAEKYLPALLAEMSCNCQRKAASGEQWLNHVKHWAREHLGEGVTVNDLAVQAGFSPSHFRKLFRQHESISAGCFLRELRLEQARNLLRQTTMSLKEIAACVGYSDAVAFHHAFSTRFRKSPLIFRRMATSTI